MPETHRTRVLIVGAGPAGYTAAIYAARAGLQPLLVAGLQPGGQLMITTEVENYPGFAQAVQGPWLMEQMQAQAEHVGTTIHHDLITAVDFTATPLPLPRPTRATATCAGAVIIATGAQARWLGLESEKRLQGFGVSACATCDGFFFRGKRVAVVGGGNTAVEEALYLTHHADSVTLIHRRDTLRAEKILQRRLFANPKVTVVWDNVVEEILAAGTPPTVAGVRLRHARTGAENTAGRGRGVRGHRPHPEHGDLPWPGGAGRRRLRGHGAGHHAHLGAGRVRRRRRAGQSVAPGRDGGRNRLHGGAGSRKVAGRARRRLGAGGGLSDRGLPGAGTGRAGHNKRPAGRHRTGRGGQTMDWDKLRVFHAVAEAGSFTHAGDVLNLSQSAVSRQISALEEALQVPLFHRHARGLILTEQGESLNRTVREVFAKLAMTEALLTESKEKPAGRLKVTTTMGFGVVLAGPAPARLPGAVSRT